MVAGDQRHRGGGDRGEGGDRQSQRPEAGGDPPDFDLHQAEGRGRDRRQDRPPKAPDQPPWMIGADHPGQQPHVAGDHAGDVGGALLIVDVAGQLGEAALDPESGAGRAGRATVLRIADQRPDRIGDDVVETPAAFQHPERRERDQRHSVGAAGMAQQRPVGEPQRQLGDRHGQVPVGAEQQATGCRDEFGQVHRRLGQRIGQDLLLPLDLGVALGQGVAEIGGQLVGRQLVDCRRDD
jgi:hypothetical protein